MPRIEFQRFLWNNLVQKSLWGGVSLEVREEAKPGAFHLGASLHLIKCLRKCDKENLITYRMHFH